MLPVDVRPHPLDGHPSSTGMKLPAMPGSIAVAERLDLLKMHGWIRRRDPASGDDQLVPVPMFGDFLLFLRDGDGPYCVNWTVKRSMDDFSKSINVRRRVRDQAGDANSSRARHAIEEQLFLDAGIRTVRVVADTIPARLDHNLRNLFLHQRCLNPIGPAVERELEDRIRASLRTGEAPQSILIGVTHRRGCQYQDVRQSFFRILWERRVLVELIDEVVLVDQPLLPERTDLLSRYSHLFAREV